VRGAPCNQKDILEGSMFDLNVSHYEAHGEQFVQDNALHSHDAAVFVFPYKSNGIVPVAPGDDIIDRRMNAPLCSNEMRAVLDMIKYRAKHLGQEIWVATGTFLTTMGVEGLEDLCRCDFVRAVEYLVNLDIPVQTQSVM